VLFTFLTLWFLWRISALIRKESRNLLSSFMLILRTMLLSLFCTRRSLEHSPHLQTNQQRSTGVPARNPPDPHWLLSSFLVKAFLPKWPLPWLIWGAFSSCYFSFLKSIFLSKVTKETPSRGNHFEGKAPSTCCPLITYLYKHLLNHRLFSQGQTGNIWQ